MPANAPSALRTKTLMPSGLLHWVRSAAYLSME